MSYIFALLILAICIYVIAKRLYRQLKSTSSCSNCSCCSSDFCQYYDDGFLEDEINSKLVKVEKGYYYQEGHDE